jgi:hypothetical protein
MKAWPLALAAAVGLVSVARGAAPEPAIVQGNYQGHWQRGGARGEARAKCVAEGEGRYRLVLTCQLDEEQAAQATLQGQTKAGQIAFRAQMGTVQWTGGYQEGTIAGTFPNGGAFELERASRKPPSLGAKPPEGAIVLLDGSGLETWAGAGNRPPSWPVLPDGSVEVRGGSIHTREHFGSCRLHVEFRVPLQPTKEGQHRGNSGVFLPNGDEIQVLDSFGNETYPGGGCGAMYRYQDPAVQAARPPLAWQTYDIEYEAPRFKGRELVAKARITCRHNGVLIHRDALLRKAQPRGPIRLQDHGSPVRYRNIWLVPAEDP